MIKMVWFMRKNSNTCLTDEKKIAYKYKTHTLHMPFSPDDIVDTNLLFDIHMHATKLLPFW